MPNILFLPFLNYTVRSYKPYSDSQGKKLHPMRVFSTIFLTNPISDNVSRFHFDSFPPDGSKIVKFVYKNPNTLSFITTTTEQRSYSPHSFPSSFSWHLLS